MNWVAALAVSSVLLCPLSGVAQEARWEQLSAAGVKAYEGRNLEEAERQFSEALAEAERATPDEWRVVISLQNLAQVARARGKDGDAEALYRRALAVGEALRGPDAPAVVEALKTLTWFYHSSRRYAEAEKLYERGRDIAARSMGPAHPRVAAYLSQLAELASLQGKFARAEALSRETLEILRGAMKADDPSIVAALNDLAWAVRVQGREDEARAFRTQALDVLGRTGGSAEQFFKTAVQVREEALGDDHPSLAKSFYDLALLFETQKRFPESERLLKTALRLFENSSPPDPLNTIEALERYASLLQKLRREAEARTLEARAAALRSETRNEIKR